MLVTLRFSDIDFHGAGCDCGLCNSNGKSYGVSITHVGAEDPLDVIYSPSETAAMTNAINECSKQGYKQADAATVWTALENIAINQDDCIIEPFEAFPSGTYRFSIWQWIEETFDVDIRDM